MEKYMIQIMFKFCQIKILITDYSIQMSGKVTKSNHYIVLYVFQTLLTKNLF